MTSPERASRRSRRQWAVSETDEPTQKMRGGAGRAQEARNRGSSSARSCSPETYEATSPFERAQALMRNKTAWNAPISDDKDDVGLRSSRTASSRPPSSLGGRSTLSSSRTTRSFASSRTSSGVTTRGTSLTRSSSRTGSRASDKKASPGSRLRQTGSSVAAQQKAKTRERAFKARAEDFARAMRSLDGGCRVTKPRLEEPDFAGAEGVPSLEPFAELQAGVMERWRAAKETAKAALEAVIEAEKMMEFLSEFWVTTDNLKKRRWDAGVDGFLALNSAVEKEYAPRDGEDTQGHATVVSEPAKTKTDESAETLGEEGHRECTNPLSTSRSGASASSSASSVGSVKGDATVSPCEDSSCTPMGKSSVSSGRTSPSSNDVSHPFGGTMTQWSSVDPTPGQEACVAYCNDFRSLGPRFQAVSETWFLTVIESAFVLKGRRGVYSREDCCTLLNTLSKVQDWLEAEPVKSRVSQTHPHDIRLLVRDTVIHWGSQLFILPSAAS